MSSSTNAFPSPSSSSFLTDKKKVTNRTEVSKRRKTTSNFNNRTEIPIEGMREEPIGTRLENRKIRNNNRNEADETEGKEAAVKE